MKEELMENLNELVVYLKQGGEFVKEQAPAYIQQYMNYCLILDAIFFIISPIIVYLCIHYLTSSIKNLMEDEGNPFVQISILLISIVAGITFFAFFFISGAELIKIIFAPKVFIMDHIISLMH